jgi:hypothetical protein
VSTPCAAHPTFAAQASLTPALPHLLLRCCFSSASQLNAKHKTFLQSAALPTDASRAGASPGRSISKPAGAFSSSSGCYSSAEGDSAGRRAHSSASRGIDSDQDLPGLAELLGDMRANSGALLNKFEVMFLGKTPVLLWTTGKTGC